MTAGQAQELAEWIVKESAKIEFGEIVVRITRHAGQTRYIERTATSREQQPDGGKK